MSEAKEQIDASPYVKDYSIDNARICNVRRKYIDLTWRLRPSDVHSCHEAVCPLI